MLKSPFLGFDKLSLEDDQLCPVNWDPKLANELFTNLIKTKGQSSVNTN